MSESLSIPFDTTWPPERKMAWRAAQDAAYKARHSTPAAAINVAPPTHEKPNPIVQLMRGASLKPIAVQWLWPGWLAAGKMHIIGGQPGTGKTTLALAMAATVTRGGRWPDGKHASAGNVVMWSGEDDPADTLVPRLIASNADMDRIHFVDAVVERGERLPFDPAKHAPALCDAIRKIGGARLVIIDPIVSAVAGDSHKNGETRRALQPLVDLAAEIGAALLGVTHFSKGTAGREPIERITGSIAFGALARVVMVAAKEQDNEDGMGGRRILMRAKSNIGPDEGGFAYDLRQETLSSDRSIVASIAVFGEAIEGTARDMLAAAEAQTADLGAAAEAETFLLDTLSGGPLPVRDVRAAADAHSIAWRTIERAKSAICIKAIKGKTGWTWCLPEDVQLAKAAKTANISCSETLAALSDDGAKTANNPHPKKLAVLAALSDDSDDGGVDL